MSTRIITGDSLQADNKPAGSTIATDTSQKSHFAISHESSAMEHEIRKAFYNLKKYRNQLTHQQFKTIR